MVNRRQFIGAGTAASVAVALAGASAARARGVPDPALEAPGAEAPAPGASAPASRIALFDERFAAARRFGAAMRRAGVPVHAIRGDVTQVWYSHLHPLWRQSQVTVAGVTAYAAMFCLERLGWDHGLRLTRLEEPVEPDAPEPRLYSWVIAANARHS